MASFYMRPVIYVKLLLIERQQYDDVYRSVVRMVCSSGKKSRYFLLDQREFLNLSSFESRGKNSSKGEVKRSEEFGCREEEYIHIRDCCCCWVIIGIYETHWMSVLHTQIGLDFLIRCYYSQRKNNFSPKSFG